ncbi:hypothetical protein PGTUg99_012107 [Puccinia graminis f. sp. tritici]|uniref:Uncharacterized protein n=1 Tax=Puccinia graminis f. sp. tritici TaxID=56615 RepID=A0A5B0RKG8_PUCGR|nr:hypothetical protein PGTUg99_012107 [Puccinia graminis f. sp. tritici]
MGCLGNYARPDSNLAISLPLPRYYVQSLATTTASAGALPTPLLSFIPVVNLPIQSPGELISSRYSYRH